MQSDPLCPACAEAGRLVGRDDKGRDLFRCQAVTCDVVEYDRELIRRRTGAVLALTAPTRRPRRGVPAYWAGESADGRGG